MTIILLGPQRRAPTVARAVDRLAVRGDLALVSAGWQEREGETADLEEHLGRRVIDLMLYRRAERVEALDPELTRILAVRQAALRDLQVVYRLRLRHALDAWREIGKSSVSDQVRIAGARSALRAVRRLDRQHLRVVRRLNDRTLSQIGTTRTALSEQRDEILTRLRSVEAVIIAGGHVAVLLNRLRLFDAAAWLRGRPIVAWSAGAMALTERVVLFHDHPPEGPGDPEILDAGLGLVPAVIALPDARRRLDLDDRARVALFASRFAPARPLGLDDNALMALERGGATFEHVLALERQGAVRPAAGA